MGIYGKSAVYSSGCVGSGGGCMAGHDLSAVVQALITYFMKALTGLS